MSRCFCGCGRRVFIRGRVANLYGGNAAKLAAEMGAYVEAREGEGALSLDLGWGTDGLTDQGVADIRDGLRECASTYREVVHRERKLSEVNRLIYVRDRDQALLLLQGFRQRLRENPEQLRMAVLAKWAEDNGLTDEEAAARLAEMNDAEIERLLARYERRA